MTPARSSPSCTCWMALLLAATLHGADWSPTVSTFRGEFHRVGPGDRHWANHEVSTDLMNWTNTAVPLPALPAGRILGACGIPVEGQSTGAGSDPGPWHALLVLVQAEAPSLHLLRSIDGHAYSFPERSPTLQAPAATSGNLGLVWHAPSRRWVLGVPVLDAVGPALSIHGSTNLLDWTPLGRVGGNHAQGGLCEVPVLGDASARRWLVVDSRGEARTWLLDAQDFGIDPARIGIPSGHGSWEFQPTLGIVHPPGRMLSVGRRVADHAGDDGFPWEIALDESGASPRIVWRHAAETESLRLRSWLTANTRFTRVGTHQLAEALPTSFELEFDLRPSRTLRLSFRLGADTIRLDGSTRELTLGELRTTLPPAGDTERWHISRTPRRIEILAANGRGRLCATPTRPAAGDPAIIEREGGGWAPILRIVLHELRLPSQPASAASAPTQR